MLYEYYNTGDDGHVGAYGVIWHAQTFTPSIAHRITSVKLKMYRWGSPGTVTVSIKSTDGDGHPTGSDLCSGTTDGNTLPTGSPYEWREITLGAGYNLKKDTKYAIVARALLGDGDNVVNWRADGTNPTYAKGSRESSGNSGTYWSTHLSTDLMFEEWGEVIPIEFSPGEEKTAVVTMSNPTVKAFDYSAELYMGTNLALMASKDFHLEAGEEKDISLPVTMPSVTGTYPVYIGVFSGGESIGLYKAVEDVVIVAPMPFTFSNVSCQRVTFFDAPAFKTMKFWCTITNPNATTIIERIELRYAYASYDYRQLRFDLTLLPGQSYDYSFDGNKGNQGPLIAVGVKMCMYLRDELGNESGRCCVTG